jgi:hypothetical protein
MILSTCILCLLGVLRHSKNVTAVQKEDTFWHGDIRRFILCFQAISLQIPYLNTLVERQICILSKGEAIFP